MNRRGFLKLLGFGLPAVIIAPKVFSDELTFPDKPIIPKYVGEPSYSPDGVT